MPTRNPFAFLSVEDERRLLERARPLTLSAGTTILGEGSERQAIFVLRRGAARVERAQSGRGIALARLEPGDVFGEVSFLERAAASASVVAENEVEVEVIEGDEVRDVLESDPLLAAHAYRSLALILARRLRDSAALIPPFVIEDVPQVNRFHASRASSADAESMPPELVREVETLKTTLLDLDRRLAKGEVEPPDAQPIVDAAMDAFKATLQRTIGRADREAGAYAFRETFPLLMQSALIDRSFAKPRGYAGDYWTMELFYRNQASGAGRLGPLIDRWYLEMSSVRAARNRAAMLAGVIRDHAAAAADDGVVPVTSLACGSARELFTLFSAGDPPNVHATCIDIDPQALAYVREQAERVGFADRMTLAQDNFIRLSLGRGEISIPQQQLIYSLGLIDYFDDELVVSLLNWIHDNLRPGGTAVLGNFDVRSPDRSFADHILEWELLYRSEDDLRRLFGASKFGSAPVEVRTEQTGVQLFAFAQRAGLEP
jgi:extracellular factor (EF) 3-hydroxypalmitic acid methyl ester biosynthesis protein